MDKTKDSYNLYFDGVITEEHEAKYHEQIEKHNLDTRLLGVLKQHYNFTTTNSYNEHKTLLWILWVTLKGYAVTIFFSEDAHPAGCEFQAKVDFFVDRSGSFEYELKNNLWIHEDEPMLDECKERVEKKLVGFGKNKKITGKIAQLTLESFIDAITKS